MVHSSMRSAVYYTMISTYVTYHPSNSFSLTVQTHIYLSFLIIASAYSYVLALPPRSPVIVCDNVSIPHLQPQPVSD